MAAPAPDSTRDLVADGTDLVSGAHHGVWPRIRGLLWTWIVTAFSLWVAFEIVPGIDYSGFGSVVGLALVVGIVGLVIRPLLNRLALAVGWVGIFFLAVFAQTVVLWIAIALARDVSYTSFGAVFLPPGSRRSSAPGSASSTPSTRTRSSWPTSCVRA